jgi:hypothetical protein
VAAKAALVLAGAVGALAFVSSSPARADLIFAGSYIVGGSGFGKLPRALTIQSNSSPESGCVAPNGSGRVVLGSAACTTGSIGGDEKSGNNKQSAPSLSSLGITDADQIGILFDGVEPQKKSDITIDDLTLKLYSGTTLVTTAVLSPEPLTLTSNPGNGNTDYLFTLDAAEAMAFDTAINGNSADTIALDSTLSFPKNGGGPDSYALVNMDATPLRAVPAPLIGGGLPVGLAVGGILIGAKLLERSKKPRLLGTVIPHAAA